jgi:hypothetical protein
MELSRRKLVWMGSAAAMVSATPRSLWAGPLLAGGKLVFLASAYGAKGDGIVSDTAALQSAIDACAAAGGGTVVLEPGCTYLSATLQLRSHVELHLAQGSRLLCSAQREEFHQFGSLIFAHHVDNCSVTGTGEIDGNFTAYFGPKGPEGYSVPQPFLGPYDPLYPATNRNPADGRPRMILLVNCRSVQLREFTIKRSPTWTIHPIGCDDLLIDGISILNDLDVPNCDGIDIDHCRNVRIANCNIVAGDDCLVLKASRNFGEYGPCEGVTITNCTLESSSAGIKIETEGDYPLRSAAISNCTIVRSNRGISFLNRDGATVEDMLFTDMTIETRMRPMMWWGSGEPIALSSVPRDHGGPAGTVRGITFSNMICRGESGIYLRGTPGAPLQDIQLRGIDLTIEKTTPIPGGFYDMRPGDMFGPGGLDRRSIAGVFAANVDGLALDEVSVRWAANPPSYYGAAVELHDCAGVSMSQVFGAAAHAGQTPLVMTNVQRAAALK